MGLQNQMPNIVEQEQEAYASVSTPLDVNGTTNDEPKSDDEKVALEKELSTGNIAARVITWTGKYLKVKYYRDNKPFTVYKSRQSPGVSEAKQWLKDALSREEQTNS